MRFLIILLISLNSKLALGAGGEGIPWELIKSQVVNVVIAILLLTFLLRKKIKALFIGRVDKFDEEFRKAQEQKKLAADKRDEIKKRLEDLKINAEKSISDAQASAVEKTALLISNTEEQAKKIIIDSENKVMNEKNKMISGLKKELLTKAFDKAKGGLSDSMSKPQLEKLNNEFIKNIQQVVQ